MKMRNILSSLLFAYALTGVGLLLLAFFLYVFKLGETAVDVGIILICIFVCFMGGLMTGRFLRETELSGECSQVWHIFFCFSLFLLRVKRRLDMRVVHAVTTFCMCIGGGTLGGMLS